MYIVWIAGFLLMVIVAIAIMVCNVWDIINDKRKGIK